MKRTILLALCLIALLPFTSTGNINTAWHEINYRYVPAEGEQRQHPARYKVYRLEDGYMKPLLFNTSENESQATIVSLPAPDGSQREFRVWGIQVMHPELAAKYPGIKTLTGVAIDNPLVRATINYTYYGFDAMVFGDCETYFIDPYTNVNTGYYLCYYKKDHPIPDDRGFGCTVREDEEAGPADKVMRLQDHTPIPKTYKVYGTQKKVFRLALSCTGEYAKVVDGPNPTKPNVLSQMAKTLARVNGILQAEFGYLLQLVPNNDTLIYLDPNTDPFTAIQNNTINDSTQSTNEANITSIIGNSNYDIGHVFCSGYGGIADFRGLCDNGHKSRAATGSPSPFGDPFDVDFVVHEMGHQLGAEHTFNYNGLGCNPFAVASAAYEPESGSTIMAYAGLCSGHNMQNFSDPYFHSVSLEQISDYVSSTNIATCGSTSASGNLPPIVPDIQATYNIPKLTPFELEAPQAIDADHDSLMYCWEQYDLGDFGAGLDVAQLGPLFRSFKPTASRWRVFPVLDSVRAGVTAYQGEKLPSVTRDMNFRLVVRDVLNGQGTFNWSDTTVTLKVDHNAGPFKVTGPNAGTELWRNNQSYTVTWDVANTTSAPVNCSHVDIYLSYDDGLTFPALLAANTPNDGLETVAVPANSFSTAARIKIKGVGNVFFDMSDKGFDINDWPIDVADVKNTAQIKVYPVPASNYLVIETGAAGYHTRLTDILGKTVWEQDISDNTQINTSAFARGVYQLVLIDAATGNRITKKVVLE